jgi:hypothetical protein
MTRSDRALRVFVLAGLSAVAACGLGLAGELVSPQGEPVGSGGKQSSGDDGGSDDGDATNGDDGGSFANGSSGGPANGSSSGNSSGGGPGSSSGGPASSSGGPGGDASAGPTVPCNFNGTWATKLTIPVNWVPQGLMSVILNPGSGSITQWILQSRAQTGTTVTDTAYVCGIDLPDFQGTVVAGSETYGVRFPDSLFDSNYLSSFTISATLSAATTNAIYSEPATATLLGIDLSNPASAPWPDALTAYGESVDSDEDGNPGVTAYAATGPGYSMIPVNLAKSSRATAVFVVIRQVTQVSGTVTDCNHISGTVTIPQLTDSDGDMKYAIDSHVIGCELEGDGGACSIGDWSFVDGTQPVFSPSGGATFTSMRMPGGMSTTCSQVRQML